MAITKVAKATVVNGNLKATSTHFPAPTGPHTDERTPVTVIDLEGDLPVRMTRADWEAFAVDIATLIKEAEESA